MQDTDTKLKQIGQAAIARTSTVTGIADATSAALVNKLNAAVKALDDAEAVVATSVEAAKTARRELGILLLEAKELYPKVKDFEAFLERIDGLKKSRAYDLMRVAHGRITDEELKADTAKRVRKHRAKKAASQPVSVTGLDVTKNSDSAEVNAKERKAENTRLYGNGHDSEGHTKGNGDALAVTNPIITDADSAAALDETPKEVTIADPEAEVKALKALKAKIKANGPAVLTGSTVGSGSTRKRCRKTSVRDAGATTAASSSSNIARRM